MITNKFVQEVFKSEINSIKQIDNPVEYSNICIDSREVTNGDLFIAIKGESTDGHLFLQNALDKGAKCIIIDKKFDLTSLSYQDDVAVIMVNNTVQALQQLAKQYLRTLTATKIAITGSNGKTTTKELCCAALRACLGQNKVHGNQGNFNNHIGLPLNALLANSKHKAIVLEMGMNHVGEIARLSDIARPTIGAITNIGNAHVGNLDSIEQVAYAKAELLQKLPQSGFAIINADDDLSLKIAKELSPSPIITFGKNEKADIRVVNQQNFFDGQKFELIYDKELVKVSIPIIGMHNAVNAACAVAIAVALGLDFKLAASGLSNVVVPKGRLTIKKVKSGAILIDDCYNANPESMKQAISLLSNFKRKNTIAILGDMKELGNYADKFHYDIGELLAKAKVQKLLTCGQKAKLYGQGAIDNGFDKEQFIWCKDANELSALVSLQIKKDDVILVKGSRSMEMECVVNSLTS